MYRECIDKEQEQPEKAGKYYACLGDIYEEMGQAEPAKENYYKTYQILINASNYTTTALNGLEKHANLCANSGDYQKAAESYTMLIDHYNCNENLKAISGKFLLRLVLVKLCVDDVDAKIFFENFLKKGKVKHFGNFIFKN